MRLHRFMTPPLLLVALAACSGDKGGTGGGDGTDADQDADGDGLTDEEEQELGTLPDEADSDRDGIEDDDEIDGGTDPTEADSDEDGVEDGAEVDNGSDPLDADSDDDGWTDGTETVTDPLDPEDHPYTGGWEIASCRDEIEGTGGDEGDIARDFTLTDQYGEDVSLYSFCDKAVLVVNFAFW